MNKITLNTLGDKVIVRKAAENGGGNEGGSGGGSASGGKPAFRYFDVTNLDTSSSIGDVLGTIVHLVKQHQLGTGDVQFTNAMGYFEGTPIAVAVLVDFPTPKSFQQTASTCGELIDLILTEAASMITEITEEEFYAL